MSSGGCGPAASCNALFCIIYLFYRV